VRPPQKIHLGNLLYSEIELRFYWLGVYSFMHCTVTKRAKNGIVDTSTKGFLEAIWPDRKGDGFWTSSGLFKICAKYYLEILLFGTVVSHVVEDDS
jgi:hypothetical protein